MYNFVLLSKVKKLWFFFLKLLFWLTISDYHSDSEFESNISINRSENNKLING